MKKMMLIFLSLLTIMFSIFFAIISLRSLQKTQKYHLLEQKESIVYDIPDDCSLVNASYKTSSIGVNSLKNNYSKDIEILFPTYQERVQKESLLIIGEVYDIGDTMGKRNDEVVTFSKVSRLISIQEELNEYLYKFEDTTSYKIELDYTFLFQFQFDELKATYHLKNDTKNLFNLTVSSYSFNPETFSFTITFTDIYFEKKLLNGSIITIDLSLITNMDGYIIPSNFIFYENGLAYVYKEINIVNVGSCYKKIPVFNVYTKGNYVSFEGELSPYSSLICFEE